MVTEALGGHRIARSLSSRRVSKMILEKFSWTYFEILRIPTEKLLPIATSDQPLHSVDSIVWTPYAIRAFSKPISGGLKWL